MNELNKHVIFYDGHCGLCNQFVLFVLKRDKSQVFKFAPLQGTTYEKLVGGEKINELPNTVVLYENDSFYFRSTAALNIIIQLNGPWKYLILMKIIPAFLRDWVYNIVAKYRYKWFGYSASCVLPPMDYKDRFLA